MTILLKKNKKNDDPHLLRFKFIPQSVGNDFIHVLSRHIAVRNTRWSRSFQAIFQNVEIGTEEQKWIK